MCVYIHAKRYVALRLTIESPQTAGAGYIVSGNCYLCQGGWHGDPGLSEAAGASVAVCDVCVVLVWLCLGYSGS